VGAYEGGRFPEAYRLSKSVMLEAPDIAVLHQTAGLAAYRMGRWRDATKQLERYGELSGDLEQLPVLMDCYRALGRRAKVAELWAELRQSSPNADVLAEARIVAASTIADSGDLRGAISLLSTQTTARELRNPAGRHLRQWYVLADLYDRAGDLPRARELFLRVARADRDAYDVHQRLEALGPPRRRRGPARSSKGSSSGRNDRTGRQNGSPARAPVGGSGTVRLESESVS
jgi:tetratricopeptide (TPR) repeat protein